MAIINRSALVSHTASEMFALVDDVDAYPDFMPWCGSAKVLSRSPVEVKARIEIAHKGIRQTFTTRNRLQPGKMIEMHLVDGPFSQLNGAWRFDSLADHACKISLDMEYEFSNKILALAIGPIFNKIANSMVDAFCRRADQLYTGK